MASSALRHLTLLMVALLGLVLVCSTALALGDEMTLGGVRALIGRKFPEVPFIDADGLARAMRGKAGRKPRLFDTRTPEEYAVSHLLGALRLDPDATDLGRVGTDKRAPIVLYCSVGYRSAAVGQRLLRAGHTDVKNLAGGIFAWANDGHPVYQDTKAVQRVHPYDAVWGLLLNAELRSRVALP